MGKKLTKNVYVDGKLYLAGAEPEKKVADRITNPNAWSTDDTSAPASDEDGDQPYSKWNAADLKAEVDKRNEGREDDDLIVVGGKGNKADLVAALEADDEAQAE